jgi:hypothetical protein
MMMFKSVLNRALTTKSIAKAWQNFPTIRGMVRQCLNKSLSTGLQHPKHRRSMSKLNYIASISRLINSTSRSYTKTSVTRLIPSMLSVNHSATKTLSLAYSRLMKLLKALSSKSMSVTSNLSTMKGISHRAKNWCSKGWGQVWWTLHW